MNRRLAICRTCPQRPLCRKLFEPDATCQHWPAESDPSLLTLAGRATKAAVQWIAAGAHLAPESIRAERLAICTACPHWDPTGWRGLGRCRHPQCGCTKAKLALATSACPMRKWHPHLTPPSTDN